MGLWVAWFFGSGLSLYEVTQRARFEVAKSSHSLASPFDGKLSGVYVSLGQSVRAGERLFELDAETLRIERQETLARLDSMRRQVELLAEEIETQARNEEDAIQTEQDLVKEFESRLRAGEVSAMFSAQDFESIAALRAEGRVSRTAFRKTKAQFEQAKAEAATLSLGVARLKSQHRERRSQREIQRHRLLRERQQMEGEISALDFQRKLLEQKLEDRIIRAPISGAIAEVMDLKSGAFAFEGDEMATIVAPGTLRIVADFPAADSLGKIQPGQTALFRLDGFPWTQYGMIEARVEKVGLEAREGWVRVECALLSNPASQIPLEHGLPGTLEVEVARVSPATLLLRMIGNFLDGSPNAVSGSVDAVAGA